MPEQVTIHYMDFGGDTYHYEMSEAERVTSCSMAGVTSFDTDAFHEWYCGWVEHYDLFPYEGGAINARSIARMWYTVEEVH